jgi:hypothetical protein
MHLANSEQLLTPGSNGAIFDHPRPLWNRCGSVDYRQISDRYPMIVDGFNALTERRNRPGSCWRSERRMDSERLSQLISNLVMNAIQHGHAGRAVRAENENGGGVDRNYNDDPPILQDSIAAIFNPSNESRIRSPRWLGQIFICQEIVAAHGGRSALHRPRMRDIFVLRLNHREGSDGIERFLADKNREVHTAAGVDSHKGGPPDPPRPRTPRP